MAIHAVYDPTRAPKLLIDRIRNFGPWALDVQARVLAGTVTPLKNWALSYPTITSDRSRSGGVLPESQHCPQQCRVPPV